MKKWKARDMSLLLALAVMASLLVPAQAAVSQADISAAVTDTAAYLQRTVSKPHVGSIGGEWAVLGLARSGVSVPEKYFQDYCAVVEKYVEDRGGVLHERKYTEYSRVIVALTAIGKDARSVAGYDLTKALGDFDKTVWQGLNGPIWALIALDSANYPMPSGGATRQMYVDYILDKQLPDGGWNLTSDGTSDPDITGMALQALANYQDQKAVSSAIQAALACMSRQQNSGGGYSSVESTVQMVVGLTSLGISLDDSRFVKNGKNLLDDLMSYYTKGSGFVHTRDGSGDSGMATEQGFYALVAVQRAQQGKNSLYNMSDATGNTSTPTTPSTNPGTQAQGLAEKHADVKPVPVSVTMSFSDIAASPAASAIKDLASRGIIGGKGNGVFDPNGDVTRAEFAKIIVLSLGLTPKETRDFTDVPTGQWYSGYVGTAAAYGIVNGVWDGKFDPSGKITRQEAAVMVFRAAKLCGVKPEMDEASIRNMLAQFPDYTKSSSWAREALAVCFQEGILSQNELDIRPLVPATRAEITQMVYNLLDRAELL